MQRNLVFLVKQGNDKNHPEITLAFETEKKTETENNVLQNKTKTTFNSTKAVFPCSRTSEYRTINTVKSPIIQPNMLLKVYLLGMFHASQPEMPASPKYIMHCGCALNPKLDDSGLKLRLLSLKSMLKNEPIQLRWFMFGVRAGERQRQANP